MFTSMLQIKDLYVETNGAEILKGVSLSFAPGKIYALLGSNGSGKSTLVQTLIGNPKYKITSGQISLDGKDISSLKPEERAKAGLFLSFQHPPQVSGITLGKFLRAVVNTQREKPYSPVEFHQLLKEAMAKLHLSQEFIKRPLDKGFSGGERKKLEILQMRLLQPRYVFLDEVDSGLDVDAIKLVAEHIKQACLLTPADKKTAEQKVSIIVITHHHKFLEFLSQDAKNSGIDKIDTVTVLHQGKVAASGSVELAKKIEKEGFEWLIRSSFEGV